MSEAWINVSVVNGACVSGSPWYKRSLAVAVEEHAQFRIHVRLKPEGAPRRYASEVVRWAWENHPDWMRTDELWERSGGISTQAHKIEGAVS